MSEYLPSFLESVLRSYVGPGSGPSPRIRRHEVEALLTDDGQRRLRLAEQSATDWASAAAAGRVEIAAERVLVTSSGLVYLAALRASPSAALSGEMYYLATPAASFDDLVDRVRLALRESAPEPPAAVDCRYGHDLDYPWPLDTGLRRQLDSHPALAWF